MNNNLSELIFQFVDAPAFTQRAELDVKLHHEKGVIEAVFDDADPAKLRIVYDPEHFSEKTLLDWLTHHYGTEQIAIVR